MKLHGTYQLLVDADDVNILGRSVHTIKENAEALVVVSMETGQEVNAENHVRGHVSRSEWRMKSQIDNSSFERVEEFKYLRINLTNQDSIQEEIKSRLKLGQVQNILCSTLLSKNLKI